MFSALNFCLLDALLLLVEVASDLFVANDEDVDLFESTDAAEADNESLVTFAVDVAEELSFSFILVTVDSVDMLQLMAKHNSFEYLVL